MAFSQETKDRAYRRAGGRCECELTTHGHVGRCNAQLRGEWHLHHRRAIASGGDDSLGNAVAMCVTCHRQTGTYGR